MDKPLLEIYATYVYIILLVTCVTIIGLYSSLTIQTQSVIISKPSLSTFEKLQNTYSKTLNCPCSEISVPHSSMFIVSDPIYHQVKLSHRKFVSERTSDIFDCFLFIVVVEIIFTIRYLSGTFISTCHI